MFRLLRIAAIVGAIAYFSPLRDQASGTGAGVATSAMDGFTRLLTTSWKGAGDLSTLAGAKALHDAALKAALRRTFDPDTTSSLPESAEGPTAETPAPAAAPPLAPLAAGFPQP